MSSSTDIIKCIHCTSVDHYAIQCPVRKEQVRESYIYRLKHIVSSHSFKRFGTHYCCKCSINSRMDPFLNETIVEARVCYYCEWATCIECRLSEDGYEVICDKCK